MGSSAARFRAGAGLIEPALTAALNASLIWETGKCRVVSITTRPQSASPQITQISRSNLRSLWIIPHHKIRFK
jgi:hypothetical protein